MRDHVSLQAACLVGIGCVAVGLLGAALIPRSARSLRAQRELQILRQQVDTYREEWTRREEDLIKRAVKETGSSETYVRLLMAASKSHDRRRAFDTVVAELQRSNEGRTREAERMRTTGRRGPLMYPGSSERDWSKPSSRPVQRVLGYEIPLDTGARRKYFEDMEAENERLEREIFGR